MIDQLVDSTAWRELLSFMDDYSGYNQIPMYAIDEENTSFIKIKPLLLQYDELWLEECLSTYQRLVNKMFDDLIRKTMEVYVDDMLVKNLKTVDHVKHLDTTFQILRKYRMRLNFLKYRSTKEV